MPATTNPSVPSNELPQDEVLNMEEELLNEEEDDDDDEVELEEEVVDESGKSTKKRTRKTLTEGNVYVFPVGDPTSDASVKEAKQHCEANLREITYTDKTHIGVDKDGKFDTSWRVWRIVKNAKFDDEGTQTQGTTVAFVCSPTKMQAGQYFAEHNGYYIGLGNAKRRRGRAKTKIDANMISFGEMLKLAIAGNFGEDQQKKSQIQWSQLFGPGGAYAHYLNEDGSFKEATA